MKNPFFISGPAVISFSGGRTSAYMLHCILQAHNGFLPQDVIVLFQNTGREMPATLDFVRDCGANWNVQIKWLEYRWKPGGPFVVEVSHNSASRMGEPFEQLLKARNVLPTPQRRFCTSELKVLTAKRFMKNMGWKNWTNVVGLRFDEPGRVERATDPAKKSTDACWDNVAPLFDAKIEEHHVLHFWKNQPFNLNLKGRWEGNCDGCFLKNRGAISRMMKDYPERMEWWVKVEEQAKARKGTKFGFVKDRESYAQMMSVTQNQGVMPFDLEDAIPCIDAVCGI